MANQSVTMFHSPVTTARVAGVLYLLIAVLAGVAHFYVPDALIVAGDAPATLSNIGSSPGLFRAGIGSEVAILLLEVVLSVILFGLLRPVDAELSLLAMVSRLVMTTVHGVNLLNSWFALQLATGGASSLGEAQRAGLAELALDAHGYGFTLGIAFLVIHVFALAVLIYRSGYFPRVLGVLFLLAGIGYAIDTAATLFVPGYTTTPALLAVPITVAEIAFPVWLVIRGLNRDAFEAASRERSAAAP